MDKPSTSMADSTMQFDAGNFNLVTTSTPMKRNNPYFNDEVDHPKKRKVEQSPVNQSVQAENYYPIASLKPIFHCPAIKGKVTEIGKWLPSRNNTKFLVFRLRDESGDIKGIVFDPMSEDFHKNFRFGATVILKNSKVQVEGKKADGTESYKLIVNRFSSIKIIDVSPAPPKPARKLIRDVLDSSNERDIVDVLGILENIGEIERNSMREIEIVDESATNIILVLWDKAAQNFDAPLGSVIVAYRVAVRIFNSTKILRTCLATQLMFDPPIEETQRLKKWYSEWTAANNAREYENCRITDNTVRGNDNTIILQRQAEIVDSIASTSTSIHQKNDISIEDIMKLPAGSVVDIVGFVEYKAPPLQQQTKSGTLRWMRVLRLTDKSDCEIELAVWGDGVKNRDIPLYSAISAKNVMVRDFGDVKTLSCLWTNLKIEFNVRRRPRPIKSISNNSSGNLMENPVIAEPSSKYSNKSFNLGNITTIEEIYKRADRGSKHNIVAVVNECQPPEEQPTKSGKITWMRNVTLGDEGNNQIELAIWGDAVKVNDIPLDTVIMARNATVRNFYRKKTLNCLWAHLQIEPNVPQAERLRESIRNNSYFDENEDGVIEETTDNSLLGGNISSIAAMKDFEAGSKHNIVALVTKCGPPAQQRTKARKITWMRVIMLMDDKDNEMEMAVWGDQVKDNDIPVRSVIMAKNVIVRDYRNEKTFSCMWTHLQIEPNIPQAQELKELIPRNSITDESTNDVIAGSSKLPENSLQCPDITSIKAIKGMTTTGFKYNIVALVTKCNPPVEQQTKAGKQTWRRVVMLMDDEESEIEMAIWGNEVKTNEIPLHSVIMAKNVSVREFKGDKTLSCLWIHLQIEPNVPEFARNLKNLIPKKSATDETTNAVINGSSKTAGNSLHCKNITSIAKIKEDGKIGSKCDIVALVTECGPPRSIQTKTGNESWMRPVMLMDEEFAEIQMIVWGNDVKANDIPLHSVIMARDVTVRNHNCKKTLRCLWSNLDIDPDVPQVARLIKAIKNSSASDEAKKLAGSSKRISELQRNFAGRKIIFTPIREIQLEETTKPTCNIIGIVIKQGPEIQATETGNYTHKRVLIVADESNSKIELTVCGEEVMKNEIPLHSVIIAQNVTIQKLNGDKTLKCLWMDLEINPDIPKADDELVRILANIKYTARKLDGSRYSDSFEKMLKESGTFSKWDLIGIVNETESSMRLDSSPESEYWFTKVKLQDVDLNRIKLVIWSKEPLDSNIRLDSILAAKNVEARTINDRLGFGVFWHLVTINPDIPEAERLKQIREEKWNPRRSPVREYIDPESEDYIPIAMIARWNEIGDGLNTIGLVVEVNPLKKSGIQNIYYTRKCVLRGENESEIDLTVFSLPIKSFEIPLNSVMVVRNATVKRGEDGKKFALRCRFLNVEFDVDIPQSKGFREATLYTSGRFAFPEDEDPHHFSAVQEIKETRPKGSMSNVLGLVVHVFRPQPKRTRKGVERMPPNTRVTLVDIDSEPITLIIKNTPYPVNNIKLHSVIAARDATLRECGDDKLLWCFWKSVEINPKITRAKKSKFKNLKSKKFPRHFVSLKTITHDLSLNYCSVDIIGEIVEIGGTIKRLYNPSRNRVVYPFTLRNEIDIIFRIRGFGDVCSSWAKDNGVTPNTIIAARNVLVEMEFTPDIVLTVNRCNITINPAILETDRGVKFLCNVPIKRILKEAKVGDILGIFAVVRNPSREMFESVNLEDLSDDSGDANKIMNSGESLKETVKLIDSSGETIIMRMPSSVAKAVRRNSGETVAIRARNLQVCKYKSDLQLAFRSTASSIDINPATKETEELLKWYEIFCQKKKMDEKEKEEGGELPPITPINLVLENCANETKATIMGIMIASQLYNLEESDLRFQARIIQVIDESKAVIKLLLWNWMAKNFDVSLNSIILVRNFHVYTNGDIKCGDFGTETVCEVITAAGKYAEVAQSLKLWFTVYRALNKNLTDVSDKSFKDYKNAIALLKSIKAAKSSTVSLNDTKKVAKSQTFLKNGTETIQSPAICSNNPKMLKSQTFLKNGTEKIQSPAICSNNPKMLKSSTILTNDTEMVKDQTICSNDCEMVESPSLFSNEIEMLESPTDLSNQIDTVESQTVLTNKIETVESPMGFANDIEMFESPPILSDDIDMVEGSQNIQENRRRFFGNDCSVSQKNEAIPDSSNVEDVIEYDADSPDMFEDC